jgi:hypothetical protein
MRKVIILLIMCVASLTAFAEEWNYNNDYSLEYASTVSKEKYLSLYKDYASLTVFVFDSFVAFRVNGDAAYHELTAAHNYIMASFNGKAYRKWQISLKQGELEDSWFFVEDSDAFVARLKTARKFSVTVPIYKSGDITFNFYLDGALLDW